MMTAKGLVFVGCLGYAMAVGLAANAADAPSTSVDPYARRSSWREVDRDDVGRQLVLWLQQTGVSEGVKRQVQSVWEAGSELETLDALARCFSKVDPRLKEVVTFCQTPRQSPVVPEFPVLSDSLTEGWAGDQLRLILGRWLARYGYLEEAQQQLGSLDPQGVADPATLLFYQAVVEYRLLKKAECLDRLDALLGNSAQVPARYAAVARLMKADLDPLRPDSLDEVSRMMARIHLRLDLGRAGTRVRQEEQEVVDKLDKMIDKLEKQAQEAAQQASAGNAGGLQPNSPAQGGLPLGGPVTPGDVAPRDTGGDTSWGDLPPKEREAALQQLGEDLPTHYRSVIEEYFRRLASEPSDVARP